MKRNPIAVLVLAAGEGTRMKSEMPKVMHKLAGRSMLYHALDAAISLKPDKLIVVVKYKSDMLKEHILAYNHSYKILIAYQGTIQGTGSAVEAGLGLLGNFDGDIVVTYGDVPLLSKNLLESLIAHHYKEKSTATVLTSIVKNPSGYGRIIRDNDGQVKSIIEEKDASEAQLDIKEVNSGINIFNSSSLNFGLKNINTNNRQKEKYLTDVLGILKLDNKHVAGFTTNDHWQTQGVNDRLQLAILAAEMNKRIIKKHMLSGVTIIDPSSTFIDKDVILGKDIIIYPNTQIYGNTIIDDCTEIGPSTTLNNMKIGKSSKLAYTHAINSIIEDNVSIGPFAHVRPNTYIKSKSHIGSYVETKNSTIGEKTKVPHLSYIGDTIIGDSTNIGAGSITANYDGKDKHNTIIGNNVKVGSGTIFVAPVTVEDKSYTGAGAVIKASVPNGSLAVSDFKQRNIHNWIAKKNS